MQKKTLSLFWHYSKKYKIERFFALFFPVLAVIINGIIAPIVLSKFLDMLQHSHITLANSWPLIALYAMLVFVGEVIVWRLALYFTWTFEVKGQRDIYMAIFDKLSREDMKFHSDRFSGSLISQSTKFIGAFERFWDMIIWSIVPMLTTVIGSIVTLSILGLWQYGLFLVFYAAVFTVIVFFGSKFLTNRNKDEAAKSTRTSGYLADMVTNIGTVKAFGQEKHEYKQALRYDNSWLDSSMRLKWGVIGATSAFSTMYAIGAAGAFLFAVLGAQYGIASVGMIYLMFVYALNINRQLWELNNITRTYSRTIGDANEMTEILTKPYKIIDSTSTELVASKGEVVFNDVSFTHDDGDGEQVFRKFNLAIPAGQRVGVVGHSGSGKTTLTRLLLRFADIDDGKITIDGSDISKVTQESLRKSIAYVAQEPLLFHRSLAENIRYGKLDATNEQLNAAIEKSHALEFIQTLPKGLDTLVGERGVKLSGGQRQRIAIARAILKDAPILVLDEATSALDSESEKLIQASLGDLMKNRTSIVIAHRLSTIAKLDRIIVLDGGKIVEDGTHAELLQKNGVYASLWKHQSGGFIED